MISPCCQRLGLGPVHSAGEPAHFKSVKQPLARRLDRPGVREAVALRPRIARVEQVLVGAGKVSHKQAVAHAQSEYEQFAAQRRAALEAEGEAYAVHMLGSASADVDTLSELGQIAKRLTKKKGGRDVE